MNAFHQLQFMLTLPFFTITFGDGADLVMVTLESQIALLEKTFCLERTLPESFKTLPESARILQKSLKILQKP